MNFKKLAIGGMIVGATITAYGASNVDNVRKLNSAEGYSRYRDNRVEIFGIEDRIRRFGDESRNLSQFILENPEDGESFKLLEQAYKDKEKAMLADSSYLNLLQINSVYEKSEEYKKITNETMKNIISLVGGLSLLMYSSLLYYTIKKG